MAAMLSYMWLSNANSKAIVITDLALPPAMFRSPESLQVRGWKEEITKRVSDYGLLEAEAETYPSIGRHLLQTWVSDLLMITVETVGGKAFEFEVDRFRNVKYLKQLVEEKAKGIGFINGEELNIMCNGERLDEQRLIDDICNNHDSLVGVFRSLSLGFMETTRSSASRNRSIDWETLITDMVRKGDEVPEIDWCKPGEVVVLETLMGNENGFLTTRLKNYATDQNNPLKQGPSLWGRREDEEEE
ncbi:hypothetical protein L1887_48352 [Cichorium endivia]|nr:hypothetical protein L1887_48352 [Cichorium endivia]